MDAMLRNPSAMRIPRTARASYAIRRARFDFYYRRIKHTEACMTIFRNVKKNFGFGCMRLPMKDGGVDTSEFSEMVDEYIAAGFNYFDTAHGYLSGMSEKALRTCLVDRYPRDTYILTDKLSSQYFNKADDVRPFFEKQLRILGVDYFDFYLMHAQSRANYGKYKSCRAYEQAFELKSEGKIRHVGISFHDTADLLDTILSEYPDIEAVQLQVNYIDYDDAAVQSKKCLEVCGKHGKPVIVMEPVKGGILVNLPDAADAVLRALNGGSNASYAIRFAAGCDGVFMVLSGMSNLRQMRDNLSYMKDFVPLNDIERKAVARVTEIIASMKLISCTSCRYCTEGCPKRISIPDLFSCINTKHIYKDWNADYYYSVHTKNSGKASDCIKCGKCEKICPQHLKIRDLLVKVAAEFEKGEA